jgi:Squalene-hopene cyclase C-terminal domain
MTRAQISRRVVVKSCYVLVTVLVWSLANPVGAAEPAPAAAVRDAVAKALPLIQKGSAGHMAQRTCFACHHQAIPLLALTTARGRAISINEDDFQKHLRFIAGFLDRNRANYLKGRGQGGQADTAGYALWTLELGGWKADKTTAAVAEYLLLHNKDLDHWRATSNRPPSEASSFTTTYLAVRALQRYGTTEQHERIAQRLGKVRAWLADAPARDTESRVFRLWAMKRVGSPAQEVQTAAQELMQTQRPEGGWAQLDTMKADAYATGTVLVALHEAAGLAADAPVYQRGVKYLLATQGQDGTWHVRSRSKPFQVYFESGFPHGKDQFISLAATSWATTALALALPPLTERGPGRP